MDETTVNSASEAARELSKLGAAKGGRARANVLTPEHRKEIAQNAIKARWSRVRESSVPEAYTPLVNEDASIAPGVEELPFSMFQGKLRIGDIQLECHVLNDFRRVFTQREIVRILSGGRESGNLQGYLENNPLFSKDFRAGRTVHFKIPNQPTIANGFEATGLIEICDTYLQAKDQGLLKKSQYKLARQSQIVIRASAKVGIIALIDEATGYDKFKRKQE